MNETFVAKDRNSNSNAQKSVISNEVEMPTVHEPEPSGSSVTKESLH